MTSMRLGDLWAAQKTAIVVVGSVVFYLSTQMFFQPHLLDFWTPAELAAEWLRYVLELAMVAGAMAMAGIGIHAVCARAGVGGWRRVVLLGLAFYAAATFTVWLMASLRMASARPDLPSALAGGLRFAVIGVYLMVMHMLWRRARAADTAVLAAAAETDSLAREQQALRLQLLKAQIEPHFLFNTLANVRRLYRLEPARGSRSMASLKRYLQATLTVGRRDDATLAEELDLVRAYLELLGTRMGTRLNHSVRDLAERGAMPFPPMVVLTLVENAIKHGLEPSPDGGRVDVSVVATGTGVEIRVVDDGVGLGGAQTGGTGVGLSNITRQLGSRFGEGAQLRIEALERGVAATIVLDGAAL